MAASFQSPTGMPLGAATISGTTVTVDQMTRPYTKIAPIVRNLVASNEGYFAERIFNTPGFTVEGGAIIYEESFPANLFLDPDKSIAPRAPGSEAPRLGALRAGPSIARPESWSGSIEITDEARRRNDVIEVQRIFRLTANTFADKIQTRAIEVLDDFVSATGREIPGGTAWDAIDLTGGLPNIDPSTTPVADISLAIRQFVNDKAGVRPDLMILNPDDAFYLDLIYGEKLDALLKRYGLTLLESPQHTAGSALLVKSKQVGVMAFE